MTKTSDMGRLAPRMQSVAARLALLVAAACVALAATGGTARADDDDNGNAAHGYTAALTALTGPAGADLTIDVDAPPGRVRSTC